MNEWAQVLKSNEFHREVKFCEVQVTFFKYNLPSYIAEATTKPSIGMF